MRAIGCREGCNALKVDCVWMKECNDKCCWVQRTLVYLQDKMQLVLLSLTKQKLEFILVVGSESVSLLAYVGRGGAVNQKITTSTTPDL